MNEWNRRRQCERNKEEGRRGERETRRGEVVEEQKVVALRLSLLSLESVGPDSCSAVRRSEPQAHTIAAPDDQIGSAARALKSLSARAAAHPLQRQDRRAHVIVQSHSPPATFFEQPLLVLPSTTSPLTPLLPPRETTPFTLRLTHTLSSVSRSRRHHSILLPFYCITNLKSTLLHTRKDGYLCILSGSGQAQGEQGTTHTILEELS